MDRNYFIDWFNQEINNLVNKNAAEIEDKEENNSKLELYEQVLNDDIYNRNVTHISDILEHTIQNSPENKEYEVNQLIFRGKKFKKGNLQDSSRRNLYIIKKG